MSGPSPSSLPSAEEFHPVEVVLVRPRRPRYWLHVLLLGLTVFTTLVVGARLQYNFDQGQPAFATEQDFFPVMWVLEEPSRFLLGAPFSAALMLILLAHEMGHYFYCRRYGVRATLPYFIPAPTLIGTLGAFIRIRSRIPSRAALFDIGIAGPIAGFVVALPALALGLSWSTYAPGLAEESYIQFGMPLVFHLLWGAGETGGRLADLYLHPVALAAWVGMFATALNLLPGGQLDGGHMVYALAPRAHRWVSRLVVLALVPLGVFFWQGWLIWAVLLMFTGMRHPQVPAWPEIGAGRKLLALVGVLLLLLTFLPSPLTAF